MKKLLDMVDWSAISAFMTGCNSSMLSIDSRIASLEAVGGLGGLNTRVTACEATGTAHNARITAAEAGLVAQNTRIGSLEAWRSAKAPASANVPTNFSVATDVITLGLAAPRASAINAIINTIMGEVNEIKGILRSREIMAT